MIAAASFYIPLAPPLSQQISPLRCKISYANYTRQPDFAHCKFLVFCGLQPTKSACSATAEKCLSGVGQPLSSVSGRKRYNTLDFASKIVCQQGCFSPLLETQSQGVRVSGGDRKMHRILQHRPNRQVRLSPLWTPRIFSSQMVPKL